MKNFEKNKELLKKIKLGIFIKSTRGTIYKILEVNNEYIYFLRESSKNPKKTYKIKFVSLYKILYNFDGRENEINTTSIRKFINRNQSPTVSVLKYCKII